MHPLQQQEQEQEQEQEHHPPERRPARQRLDDVEILVAGGGPPGKQGLESRLRAARSSGSLNLACTGLAAVPVAALSPFDHLGADEKAWEIVELTKVDVSMNELQSLPPEVSNWAPSLRVLLCRQNRLTTLPRELFSFARLTTLDLLSNGLVSFADQDPSLLEGLPALKELNLRSNQLTELPATLGALSALESLDVSGNTLAHLPASIGHLVRLQTLIANNNCIEALPPPLLSLPSLRLLDVRKNKIMEGDGLPLSLVQLRSLTHLDLRENRLSFAPTPLPPGVLSQLYLGNNRISCLPPRPAAWFASMATSLAELDLQGNALTELPLEIAFCRRLKLLDVSNNELRDIAFTLGFLPDLKRVLLEGNPLRTLRRTLFSAPISELQKFLRMRGEPPGWLLALEDEDAMTLAAELEGDAPAPTRSVPSAAPPPRAAGRIDLNEGRHFHESTTATTITPPQPRLPQPEPRRLPPPPQDARAASTGAVQLDEEIAQLEEALEALGLTKGKEQILKRELTLKRAQRSRLRASLG